MGSLEPLLARARAYPPDEDERRDHTRLHVNDDRLAGALRAAAARGAGGAAPAADGERCADEGFEARVAAQILAAQRLHAQRRAMVAGGPQRGTRVRTPAPAVARVRSAAVVLLASAAAALFFFFAPRAQEAQEDPEADDLPAYATIATAGQEGTRAPSAGAQAEDDARRGTLVATLDAPVAIVLRPSTDVSGLLSVRLFAARGAAGHASEVHAAVLTAPSGVVEVRGSARELAGDAPGEVALVVVVAREASHVDARAIAEGAATPRGVSVMRVPLRVLP